VTIGAVEIPAMCRCAGDPRQTDEDLTRYFRTLSLRELQVDARIGGIEQPL
jgi:hypothetical protein